MAVKKHIDLFNDTIPIRTFTFDMFCANPSICMIAKRGSGKSWVTRSIINYFSKYPGGIIFSKTDRMNSFYGNFFPELYIHYEYSSETIGGILKRQVDMIEKARAKAKMGKKVDPRIFFVMDDCLSDKKLFCNDSNLKEIMYNGRHYQIMYILVMQYPIGVPPDMRGNFDYIFLLAEDKKINLKKIYENYASIFPSLKVFLQIFSKMTQNYGCMVISSKSANASLFDKFFYYRANKDNIDKIGCKQFRAIHDKNYDPDWKKRQSFGNKEDKWEKIRKTGKVNINII